VRIRAFVAVLVATLSLAAPAWSAGGDDREPPVVVALGAGMAVGVAPLLAGGVLFSATDDNALKRTGIYLIMSGLTIAPAVSHLVAREYKRAAIFSAVPLAALLTEVVLFQLDPNVPAQGSGNTRTVFGVGITVGVLATIIGLADSWGAADRWRARHPILGGRF
jgi:hypothetical protein